MRVTLVDIAMLQWAIRLASWLTAVIEMGIVVSGAPQGFYRGSWGPVCRLANQVLIFEYSRTM